MSESCHICFDAVSECLTHVPLAGGCSDEQSVPVIGYGTDQFPAFFTQDSGMKAQLRRDSPKECAQLIHESLNLELPNGFVVAVPNPNPVATDVINGAIEVCFDLLSVCVGGAVD